MSTGTARWLRDRSLTLTMFALFAASAAGQLLTGWAEYNETLRTHGGIPVRLVSYLTTGHLWEALCENWESEFLQMSAFVVISPSTVVPVR